MGNNFAALVAKPSGEDGPLRLTLAAIALTALTTNGALASSFTYGTHTSGSNLPSFITVAPLQPMAAASSITIAETMTGEKKRTDLIPLAYPLPEGGVEPVRMVPVSTSIIAFESATPAVTFEKVAAIKADSKAHLPTPIVIRGGVVGGAFGTPEAVPAQPAEKASSTPVQGTPPAGNGPAAASNGGAYETPDSKAASNSGAPPEPNNPASPEQPQAAASSTGTRKTSTPQ